MILGAPSINRKVTIRVLNRTPLVLHHPVEYINFRMTKEPMDWHFMPMATPMRVTKPEFWKGIFILDRGSPGTPPGPRPAPIDH